MIVRLINKSKNTIPEYQTAESAGVDICANIENEITIGPMQRHLIPTGLFLEIPKGYEAQVRPRSGLALKKGLTVLNSPGTIDSDYRGEVGVILINLSDQEVIIKPADRIAQLVFAKHEQAEFNVVEVLEESRRGTGGFGHTGF